jgi:hypothetical protein
MDVEASSETLRANPSERDTELAVLRERLQVVYDDLSVLAC